MMFDIVIPVHKKDLQILEYCIEAAKKKIIGARRIIVVSREKYSKNAEWFDEKKFPFDIELARKYTGDSAGWYFQQLLKMHAPIVIPNILPNVMILDSDTVFFRKVKMFDEKNRPFYNISKDKKVCRKSFDIDVDEHITKLLPEISRKNLPQEFREVSGIAHNMMFNRDIMLDLFSRIEKHDKDGDKFYEIFLKHSNHGHVASEYQIYFNFLMIFYRDKIAIRKLRYKNTADINIKKYRARLKYHYCSFHSYLRNKRGECYKVRLEKFFINLYKKLFQIEQWNIGIANCNISEFLTIPNQDIKWLKAPRINEFRADPFGLIFKNKKLIFFEKYCYKKRKGEIALIELDDNLNIKNEKTILENKTHFSYPYIFHHQEKIYFVIENYKALEVALYELLQDLSLKKIKVIFDNLDVVDPSIIFYQNKFWMFYNLANKGDSELYLAYADDLFSDWKQHKNNPIKSDISSARSAGEIFVYENNLYRPAQNCLNNYGESMKINKIIKLNENEFEEKEEIEITPNQLGQYPNGIHNISSLGENLTLIDGKKKSFVPYKPLFYLSRVFCRLSQKILAN